MVSKSYSNLAELASGRCYPHFDSEDARVAFVGSNHAAMDVPSSIPSRRMIVVGIQLPLHARRNPDDEGKWQFSWDEDSLLLQLKDGIGEDVEVIYVGCLKEEIGPDEQDEIAQTLAETFNCVPTFISSELFSKFYHGFCKRQLWPLFHYMLPLSPDHGGQFDRSLWKAYVSVNKIFADRVMEVINPDDDDYVWVHDYHLMTLPTFLRKRLMKIKLGFFLHSPFPSSEIYRTLPVRDELLRGLLNSDLIGFHTFDYASHFLSCCSTMLGLSYQSKRGHIGLDYFGRTISIKILPVGIHTNQLQSILQLPDTESKVKELRRKFDGKIVILGVDDMDIFKGISLKLLAMEQFLKQHSDNNGGEVVLVQIINPGRGKGSNVPEIEFEIKAIAKRINDTFGKLGYEPVVFIDAQLHLFERIAYYAIAECCLVTAVRDGMNLIPYEYVISREGNEKLASNSSSSSPRKSMLVVSEFIGCSPSLSGAIRVNPWNIDSVAEAINSALAIPEVEKQLRHEKHYRYVSTHDVSYWARSFFQDLRRACGDHEKMKFWEFGFGLNFRVIALDPNFRKLSVEHVVSAYRRSSSRAIVLDDDDIMILHGSSGTTVNCRAITILNSLCENPKNVVFFISRKDRETLNQWFSSSPKLGIAAEQGYFVRARLGEEWEICVSVPDFDWKQIAEPVMKLYTETTDGSAIEVKECALAWDYQHADPDFGSCQAKELLDHLESVLANEPVSVKCAHHTIYVKPHGVNNGLVAGRVLESMKIKGTEPDFVLCIGDDWCDEDMFEVIMNAKGTALLSPVAQVFACTVGQKPSKAKYFLEDSTEILRMLQALADAPDDDVLSLTS